MKQRKQKKRSRKMRPSRKAVWSRAMARFRLSPEELAMAKAAGFTPTDMDEVATGRKVQRSIHDKLPLHATAGQVKRIKHEIRKRYEVLFGDAPPPAEPTTRFRQAKENRLAARGMMKLCVTIPTALRARVAVECARAGLKLDEGVQAALEAWLSRGNASPSAPAPSAAA